jgi:hypothetical protein
MSTEEHKSEIPTNAASTLNEAAKEVTQKYNEKQWQEVEKRVPEFDREVLKMLMCSGKGREFVGKQTILKAMGDQLYLLCRPEIIIKNSLGTKVYNLFRDESLVEDEESKEEQKKEKKKKGKKGGKGKKNQPKISKRDMFRLENAKNIVQKKMETIIPSLNPDNYMPFSALNSDIMEIRLIGFIYALWFICRNKSKYGKENKLPFTLGVIVAAERFINVCKKYVGNNMITPGQMSEVSPKAIEDLEKYYAKAKSIFTFDGFTICDYAPELLIYTPMDKFTPSKGITLRKNQRDVLEFVKKNFESGFLLSYLAMIASGKTTCSIALITFMETMRNTSPKYSDLQFIFCCNLASVKTQVAQYCYTCNIPFGLGNKHSDGTARITNSWNCSSDKERLVIICSPDAAYELLAQSSDDTLQKYFLFHDEPTIGADAKGSDALIENVKVMSKLPRWTILSSATMPDLDELSDFTEKFKEDHPDAVTGTVYSDEIQIGCDVMTNELNLVVPHLGCKTTDELSKIIETIKRNPFLGRIYTHNVARTLWNVCDKLSVKDLPNIPEIFSKVENLSADNIRKHVMEILILVSKSGDEVVEKVCSTSISLSGVSGANEDKDTEEEDIDDDDGFEWETDEVSIDDGPVNYEALGTTQAWRYLNMNLIADSDPVEFTFKNFKPLLDALKEKKEDDDISVSTAKSLLSRYKKEIDAHEKEKATLERNIENEDELSKKLQELEEERPKIGLPKYAQVNTKEHIIKFAPGSLTKIHRRFVREPLTLENIQFNDITVPDNITLLLMCGIGIYAPGHELLDQNYTTVVLSMASTGQLAYMISNSYICYGTNYPFNRVFVTKAFAKMHSVFTIFQLLGRAGRVGKSWKAEAYVDDECARRIIDYTRNPDKYNEESKNMLDVFRSAKSNHDAEIKAMILKMQEDMMAEEAKKSKEEDLAKEKVRIARVSDIIKSPVDTNSHMSKSTWRGESSDWRNGASSEWRTAKSAHSEKKHIGFRRDRSKKTDSEKSSHDNDHKHKHVRVTRGDEKDSSDNSNRTRPPRRMRVVRNDSDKPKSEDSTKKSTGKYVPPHRRSRRDSNSKDKDGGKSNGGSSWRRS